MFAIELRHGIVSTPRFPPRITRPATHLSASKTCAREMRGIISIANAVALRAANAIYSHSGRQTTLSAPVQQGSDERREVVLM